MYKTVHRREGQNRPPTTDNRPKARCEDFRKAGAQRRDPPSASVPSSETIKQKENCIKLKHRQSYNRLECANIAPPVRTPAEYGTPGDEQQVAPLIRTTNHLIRNCSTAAGVTQDGQDISRTPTARLVTVRMIARGRGCSASGCRRPHGSRNYEHNNNGQKEKMPCTRIEAIKLSSRAEKTTEREVRLARSEAGSTILQTQKQAFSQHVPF